MVFKTGWSGLKKDEKALIIYGIVMAVLTLAVGCLYLGKLWGKNEYKAQLKAEYQIWDAEPDIVPNAESYSATHIPEYYYCFEEDIRYIT